MNAKILQLTEEPIGFTQQQHEMLQQQLRIHVQMLTQSFLQTYSHPNFWKLAIKPKNALLELKEKSKTNATFNAWNLNTAVELMKKWEDDLSEDTQENKDLMTFLHKEIHQTNRNNRQVSRFPTRIMELMLNSTVFMYPQYLPRIPFKPRAINYETFCPAEEQLIAMGLEKHIHRMQQNGEQLHKRAFPEIIACKRMCNETIFGKSNKRIWEHVKTLQKTDYYNPVKYFFEHNCAPTVDRQIIGFENNKVLPLKERYEELPCGWKKYIDKKNALIVPPKIKSGLTKYKFTPAASPSAKARVSYLEFVREAIGEHISIPESFKEAVIPTSNSSDTAASAPPTSTFLSSSSFQIQETPKTTKTTKRLLKCKLPNKFEPTLNPALTINVNYVFNTNISPNNATSTTITEINDTTEVPTSNNSAQLSVRQEESIDETIINNGTTTTTTTTAAIAEATKEAPEIVPYKTVAYNYDIKTRKLEPLVKLSAVVPNYRHLGVTNKIATSKANIKATKIVTAPSLLNLSKFSRYKLNKKRLKSFRPSPIGLTQRIRNISFKYRYRRNLQIHCRKLLITYRQLLELDRRKYEYNLNIQRIYCKFKALELYTNLLRDLKMFCRSYTTSSFSGFNGLSGFGGGYGQGGYPTINVNFNNLHSTTTTKSTATKTSTTTTTTTKTSSATTKLTNDVTATKTTPTTPTTPLSRKLTRQEESLKHMLLPDSPEDANRKDAIYAFNFYEKVEEAFKAANRTEDCKKFNYILKSFDPKREKASELYHKLEKLFLPEHPELAQVFLTFLLPHEAAEIGKFFEYFMITNMTTFINKLNVYFSKQPAQIRKIYNCLNELAEDTNVTMKKIETKILPLLKGNQFLIDWFMQQFPENRPPERILPAPETLNLKETLNGSQFEYMELLPDVNETPAQQQQQKSCQLKYINGRIFYGSKILLPAKLSFLAAKYQHQQHHQIELSRIPVQQPTSINGCGHGIRAHGEKRLADAANVGAVIEEHERQEDCDTSKGLIVDTNCAADDSCSSIEICDELTLRAHAVRLNPGYYSNSCFAGATSTPNAANNHYQAHHPNARKTSLNFHHHEDMKLSPRKQATAAAAAAAAAAVATSSPLTSCNSNAVHRIFHSPNIMTSPVAASSLQNNTMTPRGDKRKSPTKKNRSPVASRVNPARVNFQHPMVVLHEKPTSTAITCAKRLKSLVDGSSESEIDTKESIKIVARVKEPRTTTATATTIKSNKNTNTNSSFSSNYSSGDERTPIPPTYRNRYSDDDLEFLPVNAEVNASMLPALSPSIKTDVDDEMLMVKTNKRHMPQRQQQQQQQQKQNASSLIPRINDSDEDCKLDIIGTLGTINVTEHKAEQMKEPNTKSSTSRTKSNNNLTASTATTTTTITKTITTRTTTTAKAAKETNTKTTGMKTKTTAAKQVSILENPWTRDEDKIILIEMKMNINNNTHQLLATISRKLPNRTLHEVTERHKFLLDFLLKLQQTK